MSGNLGIIKYGIGRTYLPDWGAKEALREIYQNFVDYGEYTEIVNASPGERGVAVDVILRNNYVPESEGDFLKIGTSGKRDDDSTIGSHGEGLKMAAMVLRREGRDFEIRSGDREYTARMYDDDFLGECFGFAVDSCPSLTAPFQVRFSVDKFDYDMWKGSVVKDEDVVFSNYSGSIIKGNPGDVYVGGFYVANVSGLNRAYNFPPSVIPLDRDRRVPSEFDVVWAASRILNAWEGTTVEDLNTKDARYVDRVSDKVARKYEPSMDSKGRVDFKLKDGTRAPGHIGDVLMKKPFVQKKLSKMRYEMSRKRKPESILRDFKERHLMVGGMGPARSDFDQIVSKSKGWKF